MAAEARRPGAPALGRWTRKALALALVCAAPSVMAESLTERLAPCLACHGETGRSETAEVPSLGGQPADFLLIQLYQFREKQRIAEPMNELTKDFTDDDLREFSNALARLPPPTAPDEPVDAARMAKGQELVGKHRCGFCHNPDFSGHDQIGRIAPQREDYLLKALTEYKSGERSGYDPAMVEVAQGIPGPELAEIAYYLAHWRP
jgi:cytochrome c553